MFKNVPLSRKYAKVLGKETSTGHNFSPEPNLIGVFPINLIFKSGTKSLKDLINEIDEGLYIHNLHYCNLIDHYNLLMTGLTMFGVFKIKNGKFIFFASKIALIKSFSFLATKKYFAGPPMRKVV